MKITFKNCRKYSNGSFVPFSGEIGVLSPAEGSAVISDCFIFPAFADVHVHLREPGFSYKETIESGTLAAARGGYSDVSAMPNINPVPDCLENLSAELEMIKKSAKINVHPYGAITKGEKGEELSDMEELAPYVTAFSDDGHGVQSEDVMREAMVRAASLKKNIAAHCEVNSLLNGGYIHDGEYAAAHNHKGISSESEWAEVERDIFLAEKTGVSLHICHISTAESAELIRCAKKRGVDVTCETAPHYLILDDDDLKEDGAWKMNPPLRSKRDKGALIEALCDGTIDMIATDHAPHSIEEKSKGLSGSAFGISGIETAFPLLYTYLVKEKIITLDRLIDLMAISPRRRFGIEHGGAFTVFDLNRDYNIDPEEFISKGKSTPFSGALVSGRCVLTVNKGEAVWKENLTER